jgi:ribosomal protein L37E
LDTPENPIKRPSGRPRKNSLPQPEQTAQPQPSIDLVERAEEQYREYQEDLADKYVFEPGAGPVPPDQDAVGTIHNIREVKFLKDLNPHDRKAEAWARHLPEEPMFQIRCSECRLPTWSWTEREDICENCGFELRDKMQTYQSKKYRDGQKPHNAFQRENEAQIPTGVRADRKNVANPFGPMQDDRKAASSPFSESKATRQVKNPFAREG